jgi:NAD+ synthase
VTTTPPGASRGGSGGGAVGPNAKLIFNSVQGATGMKSSAFSRESLLLDCDREIGRIAEMLRRAVFGDFRKRGAVVALSGGIDSSVAGALCVRALGKDKVFGLLLPERDSSDETGVFGERLTAHLGISFVHEDITPILDAMGCYRRRDEAIRSVIPEYGPGYASKIILPPIDESGAYRIFSVVVRSPEGKRIQKRLTPSAYLEIVAATNFKQRVRKTLEYYHADRLNYAVAGTPNRQEYDQGFFVKLGDGAADVKPIAHLYKTQVYQLAEALGIPAEIRSRPPTTDTYSMPQTQEEFFFSVPYDVFDLCLYGRNHGIPAGEVAEACGLTAGQVHSIFKDIEHRRKTTRYLHAPAALMEEIGEIPPFRAAGR